MRVTKISLATLVALGTLTCANAKTTLEEAIKGTTISGYVYGQMTSQFGDDVQGNAFRTRAWLELNTGAVGGFSVGTQVLATLGKGSNNNGREVSFLSASGAPRDQIPVGLLAVYGNMDLTEYGSKTTIQGGKITIKTPFNDTTWDAGYGVYVSNEDIAGVKFVGQVFGAYSLDDDCGSTQYIEYDPTKTNKGDQWKVVTDSYSKSYDHPLYILGVEAGGETLGGAGLKVYAAHSTKVFDYMIMGDVSYTFSGVTLQSQVAVTDVDTTGDKFLDPSGLVIAQLRGLYNIQASYSNKDIGFSAKAGFTGSFGDGYGALMNYASFNMGGQIWYDITGGSKGNGYGLTGAGTVKNSNIIVGYAGITYTGVKSLKLGLDYAYVSGDNFYALAPTASAEAILKDLANNGATLHEVSFTASYGFFDNKLTLSGLIGSTFGDVQQARGRVNVKYSF